MADPVKIGPQVSGGNKIVITVIGAPNISSSQNDVVIVKKER